MKLVGKHIKLFLILIFTFALAGFLIYFISLDRGEIEDKEFNEEERIERGFGEVESDLPSGRVSAVDGFSGGSGGGSGGGGGGSGGEGASVAGNTGSGSNCFEQQISYALKNFVQNAECIEFDSDICIKKIVECELEVHNLDSNTKGIFQIKFEFMDGENVFDELIKDMEVLPNSNEVFDATLEVNSVGEDGRANKDLSCSFNTVGIPKKEIC